MQEKVRQPSSVRIVPDAPSDPDGFLNWASQQLGGHKYELSRGKVYETMINVRRRHSIIATNVTYELRRALDADHFFVSMGDFAVRTPFGIRGPDVMVEPATADLDALASEAPLLLVEVLSASSIDTDFVAKLSEYTAIASLREYLICSQDEPRAWLFSHAREGWPPAPSRIVGRDQPIPIAGLGIELAMAGIYRGIPDLPAGA